MGYLTVSHLVLTDILLLSLLYSKCQSFQQFSHDRVAVPYLRTGFGSTLLYCQMLDLHPQPGGAFDAARFETHLDHCNYLQFYAFALRLFRV